MSKLYVISSSWLSALKIIKFGADLTKF